ncbi:MAG: peptidoglycan-binding domain-containing protein [Candidatus Omnitrophota bacterium]
MGRKNLLFAVAVVSTVVFVSGCSTVPKKFKEEVSGIKSKVDTLESRLDSVESKQLESERMVSQQAQTIEDIKTTRESAVTTNITTRTGSTSSKIKGRAKEIQVCLKNAGFYKGKVDGVKGRATKKAIKEFQRANGLTADGIVGSKTWELLSKYEGASAEAAGGAGAGEGETK